MKFRVINRRVLKDVAAEAVGDKVALGPEIFSNKCNRRDAAFCDVDAVTHGAGSAAASVPVGGDYRHAGRANLVEHVGRRGDRRVAFVPVFDGDCGQALRDSLANGRQEFFRIRKTIGEQANRCAAAIGRKPTANNTAAPNASTARFCTTALCNGICMLSSNVFRGDSRSA